MNQENQHSEIIQESSSVQSFSSEDINGIKEKSNILPDTDDNSLKEMNFAELQATLNSLKKSYENAKMTMNYINEYKSMKTPLEELAKTLEESGSNELNSLDLDKFQKEIDQFEKEYTDIEEKTESMISRISEEIQNRYGNIEKTSSFISNQMLELLEKKEVKLKNQLEKINDGNESQSTKISKKNKITAKLSQLDTMKKALNDREDMLYWKNRFSNPAVIQNLWKEVSKNYDKDFEEAIKYLCRYFKINDLNAVRTVILLSNVHPAASLAIGCVFYDLYKNLRYEKDSFKSWYGRVFIMNILDYGQGVYDFHKEDPLWIPKFLSNIVNAFITYAFNSNITEFTKIVTKYIKTHQDEYLADMKSIEEFKKYAMKEKEKELVEKSSLDENNTMPINRDDLNPPCIE